MKQIPSSQKVTRNDDYVESKGKITETIDPRPTFQISEVHAPQIKNWSPKKKYKMEIEVEMIGSRVETWGAMKGQLVGEFKISAFKMDNDKDEEDEYPAGMKAKK